jgi:hypothetical protein
MARRVRICLDVDDLLRLAHLHAPDLGAAHEEALVTGAFLPFSESLNAFYAIEMSESSAMFSPGVSSPSTKGQRRSHCTERGD